MLCVCCHVKELLVGVFSTEKDTSDSDDDTEDVFCMDERSGRMTVSSETMLTVTTETKRLDVKVKASDQDTQPNIGMLLLFFLSFSYHNS